MRVADYVISRLEELGVSTVFLVNGRGALYLTDALAKNKNISYVCTHGEQAASFGAYGYSVASGNIGACIVSSGCASTNAITTVLCAYQDCIPLIIVSGQNILNETTKYRNINIRTFGQQEVNIIDIVKSITKYSIMIDNPNDIAYCMDRAIFEAFSGRPGPVWIDIPLDIQSSIVNVDLLHRFNISSTIDCVDTNSILKIQNFLDSSSRPILLLGNLCKQYKHIVKNIVDKFKIPVVYEKSSVDVYGRGNKLSIGAIGTIGANRAANMALQNSDLVISVGARLDTFSIGDYSKFAREAVKLLIDVDHSEISKLGFNVDFKLIGNIGIILNSILSDIEFNTDEKWINKCLHYKQIFPVYEISNSLDRIDLYDLGIAINKILPDNGILVCDAGLEELIVPSSIDFNNEKLCIEPFSQGCMGSALSLAYGAYFVNRDFPIFVVVGDGSFMFNIQELQTIVHHKIPLKIIISNNNCYAVIRKRQKELFKNRTIGNDSSDGISCANFEYIANCFNIHYMHISDINSLNSKLNELLHLPQTVICEVDTLENQSYICNSIAKDINGKFVKRGLEDQFPFIDRDLFLSEMLVKPIDL